MQKAGGGFKGKTSLEEKGEISLVYFMKVCHGFKLIMIY